MKTTPLTLSTRRTSTGFTLIELLVVVAIIALLAAGSVGAYGKFINSVKEKSTAKYCVEIAGAISSFYADYDTLPVANTGSDWEGDTEDADLIAVLIGSSDSETAKKKNPRHINYLDGFKQAKKGRVAGTFEDGIDYSDPSAPKIYDTWGQALKVVMDTDFNGKIENPITSDSVKDIRGKKAIVYSTGRPGEGNQPNTNEQNFIKSW